MSKEVHRFNVVKMLSEEGNKIDYKPHGPAVVLADAYDALLAERDALAKDAERYRFLMRELGGSVSQVVMGSPVFSNEDVNAAIDAALQGAQP